jgi:hypothetical protein
MNEFIERAGTQLYFTVGLLISVLCGIVAAKIALWKQPCADPVGFLLAGMLLVGLLYAILMPLSESRSRAIKALLSILPCKDKV